MIRIKVNDIQKELSNNLTIVELVEQLQIQSNGIAIAINNNVVKRDDWVSVALQNNDDVLIIKSTQGG